MITWAIDIEKKEERIIRKKLKTGKEKEKKLVTLPYALNPMF